MDIQISPTEIQRGAKSTLNITLTNPSQFPYTRIVLDLLVPAAMSVLKGEVHLEVDRISPGERYQHTLEIYPSSTDGQAYFEIKQLTYFDHQGKPYSIRGRKLRVQILQEIMPGLHDHGEASWVVRVDDHSLQVNEGGILKGSVTNLQGPICERLSLRLQGAIEAQDASLGDIPLKTDRPFEMAVRPTASGKPLSVKAQIIGPYGALLHEQAISLIVEPSSESGSKRRMSGVTEKMGVRKILAVFANPISSPNLRLGAEDRAIKECIKRYKYRDNLALTTLHATTIHDVRRELLENDYSVVHFSGHGFVNGLVFEDDQGKPKVVPPEALAEFLRAYSPPIECVLLNACYSEEQAKLVRGGVPITIAMSGPILDNSAIEFTRGFYDAVGAGKDYIFAFEEGTRAANLEGLPCNAVLYR